MSANIFMFIKELKITFKAMGMYVFLPLITAMALVAVFIYAAWATLNSPPGKGGGVRIALINEDENYYLTLLTESFNSLGVFNNLLSIEEMDLEDAEAEITRNRLTAYVVIPSGYTDAVSYGEVVPLTFVCNLQKPLETSILMLLAKSGMFFIQASQAGVFSTIDFVREHNIIEQGFNSAVVVPINLKFITMLFNYESLYRTHNISITGMMSVVEYYIRSICFFFMLMTLLYFYRPYKMWFEKSLLDVYKANKISIIRMVVCKQLSMFILLSVAFLPMLYVYKTAYFAIIFCLASFLLFISVFFSKVVSGIMFVFVYGTADLFFSGGIIPLSLLPKGISTVRWATLCNYAMTFESGVMFLVLFGFLFTSFALIKIKI